MADGLLDFIKTPEGQGLLSTVFGGLAGAQRHAPLNSIGRAGMSGLMGYGNALERQENLDYKNLQMEALKQQTAANRRKEAIIAEMMGGDKAAAPAAPVGVTNPGLPAANVQSPIFTDAENSRRAALPVPDAPAAASVSAKPSGILSSLTPDKLAALKMGAGIDLADIYKLSQPNWMNVNGNLVNTNRPDFKGGIQAGLHITPEGNAILNDPSGAVRVAPGSIDAITQISNAKNASQARYDMIRVPMQNGSEMMMTREQAAQNFGGNPAAQTSQNRAAPAFNAIPTANPAGAGVSQSPSDRTYQDENSKAAADQYKQIQTAGFVAPSKISKYQQLGALLENHDGGKLSGTGLDIAQYANSMGMNIDKNLANKEAARSLSNEIALTLRNTANGEGMPGSMSDSDRAFLVNMTPNMSQSAEGRKILIDSQVKVLQRQADTARMARLWQQKYGRIDAVNPATGKNFFDNLQEWSGQNPLFAPKQ